MALILVVDDTRDICTAMARLLRSLGHAAVTAFSGEDALATVATEDALPDLIILDQMMPGIDGVEVLRQLRGDPRTRGLCIVMFSAISDPLFQEHALAEGADAYWPKASFDFTRLGEQVDAVVAPRPPH